MPYGDIVLYNIGFGKGLLLDSGESLLEPKLTYHQRRFEALTQEQFHKKYSWQ